MAVLHNCSAGWLKKRAFLPLLIVLGTGAVIVLLLGLMYWGASVTRNGLALLLVLVMARYAFIEIRSMGRYASKKSRTYQLGWFGEMLVGKSLRRLPDTFHVFYDVKLEDKQGNTDYVVVGPTGIFTIEVKNHSNHNVWSRWLGKEKRQSLNESRQLHQHLYTHGIDAGWVTSVLVRADLLSKAVEEQGHVVYLGLRALRRFLEEGVPGVSSAVLSTEQINTVVTTLDVLAKCKTHTTDAPRPQPAEMGTFPFSFSHDWKDRHAQAFAGGLNKAAIESGARNERWDRIFAHEKSMWPQHLIAVDRDNLSEEQRAELDDNISKSHIIARDACQTVELTEQYFQAHA